MLALRQIRPAIAAGLATVVCSTGLAAQSLDSLRASGDTITAGARSVASDSVTAPRAKSNARADTAKVPFAFADFTWLNGNSRQKTSVLDSKYFTGEFRLDATYIYDFNRPKDHTLVGTSESGRAQEVQVQQLGIGVISSPSMRGLSDQDSRTTYYLGRLSVVPPSERRTGRMPRWRVSLFSFLKRNERSVTMYFDIPPNRVVEIGTRVEL